MPDITKGYTFTDAKADWATEKDTALRLNKMVDEAKVNIVGGTGVSVSRVDGEIVVSSTGSGGGTVTSVSVVSANGVSGTVASSTTTPAITLSLGAITPTSVTASGAVAGSNLSGTNTGDQTITLTGDVTGSGTGSFAATIANDAVTNGKLANVATSTIKGRVSSGTGDPEDLTGTQATTLLDTFTNSLKGLAPASGGGTSNFLRADGSWAAPSGGGTVTTVSVVSANGVSGTVANATTTPAITLSLGAITPTSVAATGTVTGSNLSGTNTGDQTITLTGDVTGSGTGSFAATIGNSKVTYAKIQDVSATDKLLGRSSAGAGVVQEITCTSAGRALIDDVDAAAQRTTLGLGTLATQSGTFSGTSSGTNTGDQTITLTGDVTGSGTGSFAATIANDAVTYAKMQNVSAASKLLGRGDSGSGDVQEITIGSGLSMTGTTLSASGGGGGAPDNADYLVKTANATLTAERVVTDSTTVTANWATGGQVAFERAALTGDVTASANSNATTIANGVVTNAKLANSAITIAGTSTSLGSSIALDTIDGISSNGLIARTTANTRAARTITAGTGITVTNGDGVSGNPTIAATAVGVPTTGFQYSRLVKDISGTITSNSHMKWVGPDVYNVKDYGATGDGTTNDASAINSAISALNTAGRGCLYFPVGTYLISSALTTITAEGGVKGDGVRSTELKFSGVDGLKYDFSAGSSSTWTSCLNNISLLRDNPSSEPIVNAGSFTNGKRYVIVTVGTTSFTSIGASANTVGVVFTATGAGTGTGTAKLVKTAFEIIPSSDINARFRFDISSVWFNSWHTCIHVNAAGSGNRIQQGFISNCWFNGPGIGDRNINSGYGIRIANSSAIKITSCGFIEWDRAVSVEGEAEGCGVLHCEGAALNRFFYAVQDGAGLKSNHRVVDCYATSDVCTVQIGGSSGISYCTVLGNVLASSTGSGTTGEIIKVNGDFATIVGNTTWPDSSTPAVSISLTGGNKCVVANNVVQTKAINLSSSVTNSVVVGNVFNNVTGAFVVDSGTGNKCDYPAGDQYVKTLAGGAATENVDFDISSFGFSAIPKYVNAVISGTHGASKIMCTYDYTSASSTATNARCVAWMTDGTNLPAGARRFNLAVVP